MFKRELSSIAIVVVAGSILMRSYPCFAEETVNVAAYNERVKAWQDLKYGLFVHWGPCSVAGVEIGWGRKAPRQGGGIGTYYPTDAIDGEVYDNLYKKFNPVGFDAEAWIQTVKKAGMRYIILTAKHVDGFMLWDTKTSDYNIMNTPYGKDVCGELADACHRHGVKLGWYYAPCDWYDLDCRNPDPARHAVYVKRMQEQLRELMTHYGKIDILWFDTDGGDGRWNQDSTYAMIRRLQPGITINNRLEYNRNGMGTGVGGWRGSWLNRQAGDETAWKDFGDYDASAENKVGGWDTVPHESCMSMIHGQWAWRPEAVLYSATEGANLLVQSLVNNGNFLYNIGPMPTGKIEDRQQDRLLATGAWLEKVGEAVYGTRGGPILPGQWGSSTAKGKNVYLFMPDGFVNNWNEDDPYPIARMESKLVGAESLTGDKVTAAQNDDGLIHITLPAATTKREDGQAGYMIVKLAFDEVNPQLWKDVLTFTGGGSALKSVTEGFNPGGGQYLPITVQARTSADTGYSWRAYYAGHGLAVWDKNGDGVLDMSSVGRSYDGWNVLTLFDGDYVSDLQSVTFVWHAVSTSGNLRAKAVIQDAAGNWFVSDASVVDTAGSTQILDAAATTWKKLDAVPVHGTALNIGGAGTPDLSRVYGGGFLTVGIGSSDQTRLDTLSFTGR